jgi:hypothetical protein
VQKRVDLGSLGHALVVYKNGPMFFFEQDPQRGHKKVAVKKARGAAEGVGVPDEEAPLPRGGGLGDAGGHRVHCKPTNRKQFSHFFIETKTKTFIFCLLYRTSFLLMLLLSTPKPPEAGVARRMLQGKLGELRRERGYLMRRPRCRAEAVSAM